MNTRLSFYLLAILPVLFFSCKKEDVESVDFNVSAPSSSYKLSDTVYFDMSGNPDVISFYSGDSLHDYANKDRVSRAGGTLNFSFQMRAYNDSAFAAIANGALKVLVSTNFKSTYTSYKDSTLADTLRVAAADSGMINSAKWTDITSRLSLPTTGNFTTYYTTAVASISDLITNAAAPFNIAFLYKSDSTNFMGSNGITLGGFSLVNNFPDGTGSDFSPKIVAGGSKSTTWKITKAANQLYGWITTTSYLRFIPKYGKAYTESWIISNALYPNAASPDLAIPIKNITQSPITRFPFKFANAGLHKVYFIASNNRVSGQKQVVREIDLNITK